MPTASTNNDHPKQPPRRRAGRSVQDFATAEELRQALQESCSLQQQQHCSTCSSIRTDKNGATVTATATTAPNKQHHHHHQKADWLLPVPDSEAEEQTVEGELARLLTLKSYLLLDAEKEQAFDALTQEACAIFGVPTSLISLVDLGRQFFFSNTGNPDDIREGSRESAFCAHTILNKNGICVVKDTTKDERFKNNPLVMEPPFLRFYAGAPLVSPEGYKIGTFCVEGPDPRPDGLTPEEQEKLKEYAARAMTLIVERRKVLQRRLSIDSNARSKRLQRHAGVTTNLGGILYSLGETVTAMRLFQESVQTLMHLEQDESSGDLPPRERQHEIEHLLASLSAESMPVESRRAFVQKVINMYPSLAVPYGAVAETPAPTVATFTGVEEAMESATAAATTKTTVTLTGEDSSCAAATSSSSGSLLLTPPHIVVDGIPGLFNASSKLKGIANRQPTSDLIFCEAFKINMENDSKSNHHQCIDDRQFIIPLAECSKATLFNMALVHYRWGNPDLAMQFFDLAASLSQKTHPLAFDPVVLGCRNNMAQIHLQYGRPNDAMEMLSDALARGNAALSKMYSPSNDHPTCPACAVSREEYDLRRTKRLRRKLARTVMNMGHVHFFNCDYDASMATVSDALGLLHTNMEEPEVAAAWYNLSLLYYFKGDKLEALGYLEKYLDLARQVLSSSPNHIQIGEALFRKGQIMYEMGNLYACMKPLNDALRIRRLNFGEAHALVAESLCLIGKVLQAREEYDFALNALEKSLNLQRELSKDEDLSFELVQTLMELGRAYHAKGEVKASLEVYKEAADITRRLFGERHAFVARIDSILGNLYLQNGSIDDSLHAFREAMAIQVEQGLPVEMNVVQDQLLRVNVDRSPDVAPSA